MSLAQETALQVDEVLELLQKRKNVLISGPPATGKSRLLNAVAKAFADYSDVLVFDPTGPAAFPRQADATGQALGVRILSPDRKQRLVKHTTFHQGTKHRDFLRGLVPAAHSDHVAFHVQSGVLYEAAMHALQPDGAALVIIDEINRGPAVAVFGDSITAIEADKRLDPDGRETSLTSKFQVMNDDGSFRDFSLPDHLYLLASMNQADTSVEPLDVAFLRRWEPYYLEPDPGILGVFFGVDESIEAPEVPEKASDVYVAAVAAWSRVNEKIALAKGEEFQIGHGVWMRRASPPQDLAEAREYVADCWRSVRAHVDEVFFGDPRGVAAVPNADRESSPYELREQLFADAPVSRLIGPRTIDGDAIYDLLRSVTG